MLFNACLKNRIAVQFDAAVGSGIAVGNTQSIILLTYF